MKLKVGIVSSMLIMSTFFVGCAKEPVDNGGKAAGNDTQVSEIKNAEDEKKDEVDIYQNIISSETKEHAKDFGTIDDQYNAWRGTHVNNKFEYAWVATEPYVSQMDEYVAQNDAVDWTLVEKSSKFDEKIFDAISSAGYNFVRIPLDTRFFFTDDEYFNVESTGQVFNGDAGTYNVNNWQDLDRAIAWCIDRDIHVCIDVHSTPGGYMIGGDEEESREGLFSESDRTDADLFLAFWEQAAKRYSDIDDKALSFNLYNEPPYFMHERQADYIELMAEAIGKIRAVSPNRLVFVDVLDYSTSGFDELGKFSEIDNLIYSFHYYSEFQWSTEELLNGDWKSECDERLSGYNDWAKENGVKWMLQEYGIQSDIHDSDTQHEFVKYVVESVSTYDIPYCHYGFATGTPFNFYDGNNITDAELVGITTE